MLERVQFTLLVPSNGTENIIGRCVGESHHGIVRVAVFGGLPYVSAGLQIQRQDLGRPNMS